MEHTYSDGSPFWGTLESAILCGSSMLHPHRGQTTFSLLICLSPFPFGKNFGFCGSSISAVPTYPPKQQSCCCTSGNGKPPPYKRQGFPRHWHQPLALPCHSPSVSVSAILPRMNFATSASLTLALHHSTMAVSCASNSIMRSRSSPRRAETMSRWY